MHLKGITIDQSKYPACDHYPFNLPVFKKTERVTFNAPVTFFVGENGSGKSTLLRALSRSCGIHIRKKAERTCYNNPYENKLYDNLAIEWSNGKVPGSFFGSNIFHHFTEILDEWAAADPGQLRYFGGQSLITRSHGESLMSFFKARYRIKGLYVLDEPETALSPRSQLVLHDFLTETGVKDHAQFIIATHSPILLACTCALIYSFDYRPVRQIPYEETEQYKIYRDFFENGTN